MSNTTSTTRRLATTSEPKGDNPQNDGQATYPVTHPGRLTDWTEDGLYVAFDGDGGQPRLAQSAISWSPAEISSAIQNSVKVYLVFEAGSRNRPVIIGKTRPVPRPDGDRSLPTTQAKVDGRRVEFTAQDEVVLQCGEAKIVLRRNGRVLVNGAYVETKARGTNRIKGGRVLIN